MSFGFARANRDAYLLTRMVETEFGDKAHPDLLSDVSTSVDQEQDFEHLHGDSCSCQFRGE